MIIQEDYCSYQVSQLLKEKGFNVPIHTFYNPRKSTAIVKYDPCLIDRNAGFGNLTVSAPTHQMVLKWLREVHNIFIEVGVSVDLNGVHHYTFCILDNICRYLKRGDKVFYRTYEEATEAALKYSLENLI